MKTIARALATTLAGTLLVTIGAAGAGASLAGKEVSNAKYAKSLCKSLTSLKDGGDEVTDEYSAISPDDPAAFQTAALALFDDYLADIDAAQKKMKKLSPENGGKGITKIFDSYFKELSTTFGDALDEFRAADPNGVAFQADVAVMQNAFSLLTIGAADPFSEIDEQDLLGAFGDEKSCEDVVTIFGG